MLNFIRRRRDAQRAETERVIRDSVEASVTQLRAENNALRADVDRLNASVDGLLTTNASLRATVRTQTEADLVLVSLKIVSAAVNGDAERATSMMPQQDALRAALSAMPDPYASYGIGNLYGSLLGSSAGKWWPH